MSAPHVIALMGAKQSGKDTLADYLVRVHGYKRLAFADVLKDALVALNPIVVANDAEIRLADLVARIGMDRAKEDYPEVRRLLQEFGVAMRAVDPDIWINGVRRQVDDTFDPVIITDVRFPNEYEWAKSRDALLTRIVRPGLKPNDPHPSEAMAWDFKGYPDRFRVANGGTLRDLFNFADHLAYIANMTSVR